MPGRNIIVIGCSAGGVQALGELFKTLPKELEASIFVVQHIPSNSLGLLPEIIQKTTALRVHHPKHNEEICHGTIYMAPPDRHMLLEESGRIYLTHGARVNRSRPAIDPLFRSAAITYGKRVICIILSGLLDDGTLGAMLVKNRGGLVIVQDPKEAQYADMPNSVLDNVEVDYNLPITEIAELIVNLVKDSVVNEEKYPLNERLRIEAKLGEGYYINHDALNKIGEPSIYTCPECHGTLWEISKGNNASFRCRVGHAYGIENLEAAQEDHIENALWAALRALEENINLSQRMIPKFQNNQSYLSDRFKQRAEDATYHAKILKGILLGDVAFLKNIKT